MLAWERYLPTTQKHYLPEPGEITARSFLRTEYEFVDGARGYHSDAIEYMAVCLESSLRSVAIF